MNGVSYSKDVIQALKKAEGVLLLAPKAAYKEGWHEKVLPPELVQRAAPLIEEASPGSFGTVLEDLAAEGVRRLMIGVLPDKGSRHNSPTRGEAVRHCARRATMRGTTAVIATVDDPTHVASVLANVVRGLPLFNRKSDTKKDKTAHLQFVVTDRKGRVLKLDARTREVAEGVRWAARLVDVPTSEMSAADFAREAKKLVRGLANVTVKIIVGEDLLENGLGGIHAVGRCATVPPRLVILDYKPPGSRKTVALVGKGVVYDTGGLSLKPTAGMSSMKGDMAGAAGVVGAFRVLAATKSQSRIVALAALAENAIGPHSYRNDDILTLHSGHTVEINNTDAEGRLLLGDGVSFVARKYKPDVIIDAATLTGAQLIATGIRHAAVVSNRAGLERAAVLAGRRSGDLTFPLPFVPEFYEAEFKSVVADMKNSVKERANAQSSCAAQFVYNQIDDLDIPWLHIDQAGPSFRDERGTGFGVALISEIVFSLEDSDLAE